MKTKEEINNQGLPFEEETVEERKSKSAVKRELLKLQEYGARLVELSPEQLGRIGMPEELREAVLDAKRISPSKHGARKRQLHHIGALLREVDAEPIIRALDNTDEVKREEARRFRQIELWRDRLIDGEENVFGEISARHPDLDRQQLRQLIRNAQKEKAEGKPPKSSRALFRFLASL